MGVLSGKNEGQEKPSLEVSPLVFVLDHLAREKPKNFQRLGAVKFNC